VEERVGIMPVFLGALKPKLLLGMDSRILLLATLSLLGVIFSVWMVLVCGAFVIVGRILGKLSPYLVDELIAYMEWRVFAWNGVVPDDVFIDCKEPRFLKEHRRVKQ
jgi:hypothetical protein